MPDGGQLFGRPTLSPSLNYFDNMGGQNANPAYTSIAVAFNSLVIQPLTPFNELFPGNMTVSTAMFDLSFASFTATSTSTNAWSSSFMAGFYTSVNSTQLSLVNSFNSSITKGAASNMSTMFSGAGPRWLTVHSSLWSATPVFTENQYWMAVLAKSSGTSMGQSSVGQYLLGSVQRFGTFGTSAATATSQGNYPFMGVHVSSQTALPVTIAASQINKVQASANWVPHVVFNNLASVV